MNQVSIQNSKTSVEKNFYKLMNNSNFGCDCRKNVDNCLFAPICDEINKISYIKKYQSLFDDEISDFVSCELMTQEMECEFDNSLMKLNVNDEFYEANETKHEKTSQK